MFKNLSVLLKYSIIGQIINLFLYPLLTYFYTPSQFALFNYYYFGVIFFSLTIGWSQEYFLINIGKNNLRYKHIITILRRYFIMSPLLLIILSVFYFSNLLEEKYLIIVILSFIAAIIFTIYNSVCEIYIRLGKMTSNAKFRFLYNVVPNLIKTLSGVLNFNLIMIISDLTVKMCVCKRFIVFLWSNKKSFTNVEDGNISKDSAEFNKYYPVDNFLNVLNGIIYLPAFGYLFGDEKLGIISFCFSLLYVPVSVFTSAFKDLFRNKIVNLISTKSNLTKFTISFSIGVFLFALLVFLLIYFIFPIIFTAFFSEKWTDVINFFPYMIPLFFFNFFAMSFSGVLVIINNYKVSLYYQLFNTTLNILFFYIIYVYNYGIIDALFYYSIVRSFSYIVYYFLMLICLNKYRDNSYVY